LIFIPLVGLPARGKTHIARSLERYLRWLGVKTRVFSLGDYRRKVLGGANVVPEDYFDADAKSPETIALRKKIKDGVEDQVWDFFSRQGGQVVIYDANNGDRASRKELLDKFEARGVHVIFLGEFDERRGEERSDEASARRFRNLVSRAEREYGAERLSRAKREEPLPSGARRNCLPSGARIDHERSEKKLLLFRAERDKALPSGARLKHERREKKSPEQSENQGRAKREEVFRAEREGSPSGARLEAERSEKNVFRAQRESKTSDARRRSLSSTASIPLRRRDDRTSSAS
jgi:predicted kinase